MSFHPRNLLYTLECGPENASTLVFLHGGGGAGWMWKPQLAHFKDYHCLVPDLPEHGQSAEIGPLTVPFAAEKVAELITTRAHGGRAYVVGLSLGAQVLVSLLSQAPELVEKAVISSALVHPLPGSKLLTPGLLGLSWRWSVPPFKNNDGWIRLNMKYSAGIPDEYFPDFKMEFQRMTESGFVHAILANQAFHLPGGLDKVKCPVLVVVGKGEYGLMRKSASDMVNAIPAAQGYQVAHRKKHSLAEQHNWSMSEPEMFSATVRAWIEGKALPPELEPLAIKSSLAQP